jgi:hypothetical protein
MNRAASPQHTSPWIAHFAEPLPQFVQVNFSLLGEAVHELDAYEIEAEWRFTALRVPANVAAQQRGHTL